MFEDKVVDFILEMADVRDDVVTPEELLRDPDEPDAAAATDQDAAAAAETEATADAKAATDAETEEKAKSSPGKTTETAADPAD